MHQGVTRISCELIKDEKLHQRSFKKIQEERSVSEDERLAEKISGIQKAHDEAIQSLKAELQSLQSLVRKQWTTWKQQPFDADMGGIEFSLTTDDGLPTNMPSYDSYCLLFFETDLSIIVIQKSSLSIGLYDGRVPRGLSKQ